MQCNYCEGQCTCYINPPCSFCESHRECDRCGKLFCDDLDERFCPDCRRDLHVLNYGVAPKEEEEE